MTVYTIYAATTDGWILSGDASYALARAGINFTINTSNVSTIIGQRFSGGNYSVYQGFFQFDTSTVLGLIQSAVFALYGNGSSAISKTLQARLSDWGAGLTTADFIAGASLSALPLLADFNLSGYNASAYNNFTSDPNFITNINQAGSTRFLVCAADQTNNVTPVGDEFVNVIAADQTGTSTDPKLTITTYDEFFAKVSSY